MAYMNQEKKAKIVAELKKVMPADWKYSVSVEHLSTIVLTISKAPVNLAEANRRHINPYYPEYSFSGETLETFRKIISVLNLDNFDKSDLMSDYHHVGHYVDVRIGRWDKPFIHAQ